MESVSPAALDWKPAGTTNRVWLGRVVFESLRLARAMEICIIGCQSIVDAGCGTAIKALKVVDGGRARRGVSAGSC